MMLTDKFFYSVWNIGFFEGSPLNAISCDSIPVKWMNHGYKDRFFADPFILSYDENEIKVLVEEFPFYHKKGVISLLVVDRQNYALKEKYVVLEKPFHMSYPFIQRTGESLYVAPEASASGALYSYEFNPQSSTLSNQQLLIREPLLDSTIINYNGLFWMFSTKRGAKSNCELYIYYSSHYEGPWIPHKLNPVVQDYTLSRPAGGLIVDGNNMFRVTQKCDVSYGESVLVTKINELTESSFKQSFVKELRITDNKFYAEGFHTINGIGELCVVDGLSRVFAPIRRVVYESIDRINRLRR